MGDDSPDVVIAKQLLDYAKLCGFEFQRIAPGDDGPLVGNRTSGGWVDIVHIEGFSRDCLALFSTLATMSITCRSGLAVSWLTSVVMRSSTSGSRS